MRRTTWASALPARALAIAAAMCCASATAQTIEAPHAETVSVSGWAVTTHSRQIAQALATETANANPNEDALALAQRLQAIAARKTGLLSIQTEIDANAKSLRMETQNVASASGSDIYSEIFGSLAGKPLTQADLEAKTRVAREAAKFNNDSLTVHLGLASLDSPDMAIETQAKREDDSRWGGVVSLSTYGQRNSSRDLLTAAGYARLREETQLQFSATDGLAGLRADSRGGYYHSNTLELDHVFVDGIASLKLNDTRYRQGGALRVFDQRGEVQRLDADFKQPLSAASTVTYGAGYIKQKTIFGVAGLWDKDSFGYASLGYEYTSGPLSWSAKVIRGLGGARSFNTAPLGGAQDTRFVAVPAEARYEFDLGSGWALSLASAAQIGSRDTPSAMQFYAGGPERGRAFITGNIAGPSGVSASATAYKQLRNGARLYFGVDGARMRQVTGPSLSQASAFTGISGQLSDRVGYDIGIAKPFGGISKKPQISLMLNIGF